MNGRVATSATANHLFPTALPIDAVRAILAGIDATVLVADRAGRLLAVNGATWLELGQDSNQSLNIFESLFGTDGTEILAELGEGKSWVERAISKGEERKVARVKLTPDTNWVVVQLQEKSPEAGNIATQLTVQELLQEREINYGNLLAV
jgi:hypothetical protein